MTKQLYVSEEMLQLAADSAHNLTIQLDNLLKLREAVAAAEAAVTHCNISGAISRAGAVAFEADARARRSRANARNVRIHRSTTVH